MADHFDITTEVTVRITVNDRVGVIDRYLEGGEFHGQHPYSVDSQKEILRHLAYNAISNGVTRANALDGWADLADDAAVMDVTGVDF